MATTSSGLIHPWYDIGDVAPQIPLKDVHDKPKLISRLAGKAAVIHMLAPDDREAGTAIALAAASDRIAALDGELAILRQAAPVQNLAFSKKHDLSCQVLSDEQGQLAHNLNQAGKTVTVIFDRGSRLRAIVPVDDGDHEAAVLTALERSCPAMKPSDAAGVQAPLMVIPGVLDPDYCNFLMNLYRNEGNIESGFMETTRAGSEYKMDANVKRRRDHVIGHGHPLEQEIRHIFNRRINPEIARNTYYEVKSHEEFKVVRYSEEEQGFFKPHRDNNSTEAGGRRFAVSLLLNDAYEGGELIFPEYGPISYRPGAGDAAVFACGLLHEVKPVTKGERFVMLAFLH